MNTSRNGYVVSNSGGVYKGSNKPTSNSVHEYEEVKMQNGKVLIAGLILVVIMILLITNIDMIKSAIM